MCTMYNFLNAFHISDIYQLNLYIKMIFIYFIVWVINRIKQKKGILVNNSNSVIIL